MNNTFFSDDRFSDQSVRTSLNSQELQEHNFDNKTFTETRDSTTNHRFFHKNPNERRNLDLTD